MGTAYFTLSVGLWAEGDVVDTPPYSQTEHKLHALFLRHFCDPMSNVHCRWETPCQVCLHEDDFMYNARLARSSLREKRRCDLPLVGPGTAKWFFCARFRRRSISVPRVPPLPLALLVRRHTTWYVDISLEGRGRFLAFYGVSRDKSDSLSALSFVWNIGKVWILHLTLLALSTVFLFLVLR